MLGLSTQLKHPRGWLYQRGLTGSCWLVLCHFLWLWLEGGTLGAARGQVSGQV